MTSSGAESEALYPSGDGVGSRQEPLGFELRKRRGATLMEYALLIVLVATLAVLSVKLMAGSVAGSFVAADANIAP